MQISKALKSWVETELEDYAWSDVIEAIGQQAATAKPDQRSGLAKLYLVILACADRARSDIDEDAAPYLKGSDTIESAWKSIKPEISETGAPESIRSYLPRAVTFSGLLMIGNGQGVNRGVSRYGRHHD